MTYANTTPWLEAMTDEMRFINGWTLAQVDVMGYTPFEWESATNDLSVQVSKSNAHLPVSSKHHLRTSTTLSRNLTDAIEFMEAYTPSEAMDVRTFQNDLREQLTERVTGVGPETAKEVVPKIRSKADFEDMRRRLSWKVARNHRGQAKDDVAEMVARWDTLFPTAHDERPTGRPVVNRGCLDEGVSKLEAHRHIHSTMNRAEGTEADTDALAEARSLVALSVSLDEDDEEDNEPEVETPARPRDVAGNLGIDDPDLARIVNEGFN